MDKAQIDTIAWLARLQIEESDADGYRQDLESILGLVEQMNEVDTSSIKPMAHPLEIKARLREDEVTESDERDKFQSVAPDTEKGLYLVPRVIE